jgi:hypothetical protein
MLGADLQQVQLRTFGIGAQTDERLPEQVCTVGVGEQLVEQAAATATGGAGRCDPRNGDGTTYLVSLLETNGCSRVAAIPRPAVTGLCGRVWLSSSAGALAGGPQWGLMQTAHWIGL